uniref:Uncharacterized protein n=1 Tax=Caenorhabditis japonica TaxID=281687 RepID=A0A8R1DUP1_CAEJA
MRWRIAIIGSSVNDHECIDVSEEVFDYSPALGDVVKIGFENLEVEEPTVIKKGEDYEWLRDVKVINSTVVIFAIVHLSDECLKRNYRHPESDRFHYIVENDQTDFRRIAIPKQVVDHELSHRSVNQKSGEPIVYRIGLCYDPTTFEHGLKVRWRYYNDFALTPIFELYGRDSVLPFLAESMVYGVLEGIVIARNEEGVMCWSPQMGCAVMPTVTSSRVPPLGNVNLHLVKRCLADTSFNFSCCYELLPSVILHQWPKIKIITDTINGCVYIEGHSECVKLIETDDATLCLDIPHLGKIWRGLEPYKHRLREGRKYHFRVEFKVIGGTYEPVIVDLRMQEDVTLKCRIVYVSSKHKKYYAVLEPAFDDFNRFKESIDFIEISFRTLFCSLGMRVRSDQLLLHCFSVLARKPRYAHDTVEAVHVNGFTLSSRDTDYRVFQGRTWIRTVAVLRKNDRDKIDMLCPRLSQLLIDFSRISCNILPYCDTFAVQAQFALTPDRVPLFLIRHVSSTFLSLPKLTAELVTKLPSLRVVFDSLFVQSPSVSNQATPSSSRRSVRDRLNDCNSFDETTTCDSATNRSASPAPSLLTISAEMSLDESTVPTILNESEFERLRVDDQDSMYGISDVETWNEGSSTAGSSRTVYHNSTRASYGDVVNESWLDSSCASPGSTRPPSVADTVIHKSPSSSYASSIRENPTRGAGFGAPSFRHKTTYRPVKFGIRKLPPGRYTSREVLDIMVQKHIATREMFVENARSAVQSWFTRPRGRVVDTKKRHVEMYGIESTDFIQEHNDGKCPFARLVRFIAKEDMPLMDMSFVVPIGGEFPQLPKNFELGRRYRATHYSFFPDKMVRIDGHAETLGTRGIVRTDDQILEPEYEVIDDNRGHQFLRIVTLAYRPSTPYLTNDDFEVWDPFHLPGFIIVEKIPEVMKCLAPLDPGSYIQDQYSIMVEPVAGGPIEIANFDPHGALFNEPIVFWRLVCEFSKSVPLPKLIERRKVYIPPEIIRDPRVINPKEDIENYGMFKTMEINQKLAQERIDRLRALGDPRVKMCEGPELSPEMEKRKVDIAKRRESMLFTMEELLKELPRLHQKGYFCQTSEEELEKLIDKCEAMHDDHHPHQFRKRNAALSLGCNWITSLLVREKVYKTLNDEQTFRKIMRTLADCIGLNASYVTKGEGAKRLLQFLYEKKLHNYI